MAFRFAQIAPPGSYAHVNLLFVFLPEPITGFGFKNINQASGSKIELFVDIGIAQTIGYKNTFCSSFGMIGNSINYIWFSDQDGFNALFPEFFDHPGRIRPCFFVPVEFTKMPLYAIAKPIKIEDYGIHRKILFQHKRYNTVGFFLIAVCHAALQVSQCPARRQRLTTSKLCV